MSCINLGLLELANGLGCRRLYCRRLYCEGSLGLQFIWSVKKGCPGVFWNFVTSPQSSVRGLDFWFDFGSIDRRTSVRSGKAMIEV